VGFLSGWGPGLDALPADARAAAAGRPVVSCGRPAREGDRFRRATREGLLALAAVDGALAAAGARREAIAGERTAIVYVTAAAYGPSNRRFTEGRGGTIHFAETAPAVVPAEVAIEFDLRGPYAILIGGPPATLRAIWHAATLLAAGACDRALVLAVEIFAECADLYGRGRRRSALPLVEAAGCAWLEPGQGSLRLAAGGGGPRDTDVLRRRLGETFSCQPVAALERWRRLPAAGTLDLEGAWRGESARLVWTGGAAGGSAA
jgi:hypothetical protein